MVLVGTAAGTYTADDRVHADNAWMTPAAWRALTHGGQLAEWQVFADNEPIRRRMARAAASSR